MDRRESRGDADQMWVAGRQAHLSFTPTASASAQAATLQVALSGLNLMVPQQAVLTVLSFPCPKAGNHRIKVEMAVLGTAFI